MHKRVTAHELIDALLRLGFDQPEVRGKHLVLRHPPSGTVVALPKLRPEAPVGQARLAAIRFSVIGREVATAAEFDDMLASVHA